MTSSAEQMRRYKGPAIFSFGFRPFFLGGSIIAAVLPLVTALVLAGVMPWHSGVGVIIWHGHEMIYGYLAAIAAGFILTAVPNWTGRLPMMGRAPWVSGGVVARGAFGDAGNRYAWRRDGRADRRIIFVSSSIYFCGAKVITGKNWRNAPVCLLIALLATGNALWHFQNIERRRRLYSACISASALWRYCSLLLAAASPRALPATGWQSRAGKRRSRLLPCSIKSPSARWLSPLARGCSCRQMRRPGLILLVAGALHFVRLMRWRGWRCAAEPLVLILHIGYFWLALAVFPCWGFRYWRLQHYR